MDTELDTELIAQLLSAQGSVRWERMEDGERIYWRQRGAEFVRRYEELRRTYTDDCAFCDRMKTTGQTFFPRHNASGRCESGGHNHCTCDVCF